MRLPWQTQQWQQLWHAKQEHRLPHALLFAGMAGTGKFQFANHFAATLLCQKLAIPAEEAQGALRPNLARSAPCASSAETSGDTCHSCRLMAGKVHPNMLWITPEKEGQAIKIDQIREVFEFIHQTSLQGEYRIVIIHPANQMNLNAANALLKTLEEPPAGSLLILISNQLSPLPATILSRCQSIFFPCPPIEQALPWLKEQLTSKEAVNPLLLLRLTQGAPLAALQFVQEGVLSVRQHLFQTLYALSQQQADPIKAATTLSDIDLIRFLDFMLSWILDILRLQLDGNTNAIMNEDFATQITELHQDTLLHHNIKFMDYLQQLRGQICAGINMNKQLLIESVLVRWSGAHHVSS